MIDRKLIFLMPPKTASRSLLRSFETMPEIMNRIVKCKPVHHHHSRPGDFSPEMLDRCFVIGTCRHPLRRLISAWRWVFFDTGHRVDLMTAERIKRFTRDFNEFCAGISEIVPAVRAQADDIAREAKKTLETCIEPRDVAVHFVPQTSFLMSGGVFYPDFLCRQEQFRSDFDKLCGILGVEGGIAPRSIGRTGRRHPELEKGMPRDAIDAVTRFYRTDYEVLGYEP